MTPVEASWVRKHAWTQAMRRCWKDTPAYYSSCSCQYGECVSCRDGKHRHCSRGYALRRTETMITDRRGRALYLPDYYTHPSNVSATGPARTNVAQVWLADRTCRWLCPCPCRSIGEPVYTPSGSLQGHQASLFAAPA
ncbi:DUF6248 family natural product biosynthesis protein [Nonomuraea sp. NPDC050663]|uniref:DUF6248 family natural product biosynthesis protein n=1 Tax=Nonomuraea sp. NPDC050663 TaxID=3364370 RepID=UPI0037A17194